MAHAVTSRSRIIANSACSTGASTVVRGLSIVSPATRSSTVPITAVRAWWVRSAASTK